jgi:hypothetical protein
MPVLNEISVGGVIYQEIEGAPTHSGVIGSIAFDKSSGRIFSYTGGDGGRWESLMTSKYGRTYYSDSNVLTDRDSNDWVLNGATSIGGLFASTFSKDDNMVGFTSSFNGSLRLNSPNDSGRYLVTTSATFLNSSQALLLESGPIINTNNETSNPRYRTELIRSATGSRCSITTPLITEILPGQLITLGTRYILPSGISSGYRIVNSSIQVYKVHDAVISYLLNEEWGTGTFSTNSWTVVNGTQNRWFVGTASSASGSYSAYISNDSGVSNAYSNVADISHFYKDITIPNESGDFYLSFDWRCNGEDSEVDNTFYDYGSVVLAQPRTNVVAGTEVSTTPATILNGGPTSSTVLRRIGAVSNNGKFNNNYWGYVDGFWRQEVILLNNYKGLSKRLVFTWKSDNLTIGNPPFAVDNIKIFKRVYI